MISGQGRHRSNKLAADSASRLLTHNWQHELLLARFPPSQHCTCHLAPTKEWYAVTLCAADNMYAGITLCNLLIEATCRFCKDCI